MGLLEKVRHAHVAPQGRKGWSQPNFWDVEQLRWPFYGPPSWGDREAIEDNFLGYVEGVLKRNGPVFALMLVRMMVFSEARFRFRRETNGRPGALFGDHSLAILERPWTNATTGDLLARMLQSADLAGNAFVARVPGADRLRLLRPDWMTIISASESEPDQYGRALDAEVIAYIYGPPGGSETLLLPSQVAHFAPIPDPVAYWRGMSWVTAALQEVSADLAATKHKLQFFRNGATPQVVVSMDASLTSEQVTKFAAQINAHHQGVDKAYKTMVVGGGADVTVAGRDLAQLDFKATQGAGETRLAAVAGVPSVIVGFSEGLAGSSLNAGNFGAARRRMADATMRPLWRNAAGSLATLVPPPDGAELWYDERDIAFLREDSMDAAKIFQIEASTIGQLIRDGHTPASARAAVMAQDASLLEHTGLVSVQLLPPNTTQGAIASGANGHAPIPG
jgi:phage portal protein BeeE